MFMTHKSKYTFLYIGLALSIAFLCISEYLYHNVSLNTVSKHNFSEALFRTIEKSDKIANNPEFINWSDDKILKETQDINDEIILFIYEENILVFWNSSQIQINADSCIQDGRWHFKRLENIDGIYKWYDKGNNLGVLTFLPVKFNYPYTNNFLKNNFNTQFKLYNNFEISDTKDDNSIAIEDNEGDFLFSLNDNTFSNSKKTFQLLGFISAAILFLLMVILYVKINQQSSHHKHKKLIFWLSTLFFGIIILLCSVFSIPDTFFFSHFFPAPQYAANHLISSLTHISIFSIFTLSIVLNLYFNDFITDKYSFIYRIAIFLITACSFILTKYLVLQLNINLNINSLNDLNVFFIWSVTILFIVFTSIYLLLLKDIRTSDDKISKRIIIDSIIIGLNLLIYFIFVKDFILLLVLLIASVLIFDYVSSILNLKKLSFNSFAIYIFFISFISFINSSELSAFKKNTKYEIQTENIYINGYSENDPIAELLLEEFYNNMYKDYYLLQLTEQNSEQNKIVQHLYQKYIHAFGDKFNIKIYPIDKSDSNVKDYKKFIEITGKRIANTEFFSLPASLYNISFAGIIDIKKIFKSTETTSDFNIVYLCEFIPLKDFRSYSFPDLLISKETNVISQPNYSIAKYEDSNLIYSDQKFKWQLFDSVFYKLPDGFTNIRKSNQTFYVFSKDNVQIALTETIQYSFKNTALYIVVCILIYLLIVKIILWIYQAWIQRKSINLGITSKFQLIFISLLVISFISTLYFSINYIKNNYKEEQTTNLNKKKKYIQKSLQDIYYWTEDVNTLDVQILNNNLQEIAYRYQTDINIYDNSGLLLGSSQPLVFSKNLLSHLISPTVFFSDTEVETQTEKIGELSYLATYTDMINGDFLQIGYISIPQYFSQTELNDKIENFLGSILQIYLIVLIISIILILLIGRQLSVPLSQLEIKLKSMRLGDKNEKIEYNSKDEIGQLVEQYNKTVDELEKSTQLLIASEREFAWRTMARQIAHEINNPLTPMKLTIQQLLRTKKKDSPQFDEYFEKASNTLIEQIDNLSRIAGTFAQFARLPETKLTSIDIAQKLTSTVILFQDNFENINIKYSGPETNIWVDGDSEQIIQVFNNILKNATQSIKSNVNGEIKVNLTQHDDNIKISFKDNGSGIPLHDRENIFKPNFTTKSTGMGLGLSISKSIIENMGGEIYFETEENIGTTFYIKLKNKTH